MSRVIGGVGTSHIPTIGHILDKGLDSTEEWAPAFAEFEPAREWVSTKAPDVAVVIYNDHAVSISLDMVPTFAIGVADSYEIADEGRGARPIPSIEGEVDLAWHLADSLVEDEFDMAVCQRLDVDHGVTVPMSVLWGSPDAWPVRVIPIAVNVLQQPTPTPRRCLRLGQAIRKGIDSFGGDLDVVVVGTGGMSHQLQGQRAGHIDSTFDQMFLDNLGPNPEKLADMPVEQYIKGAGSEGAELVMWLVMRGALGGDLREVYRNYRVPISNTAAGLIVFDED